MIITKCPDFVNEKCKPMKEIITNLHIRSKISGSGASIYDIAQAGLDQNIDVLLTSDRNVYLSGQDQYYYRDMKKLLVLCGEEILPFENPSRNHLLIFGAEKELYGNVSAKEMIRRAGTLDAISILAHPFEAENRMIEPGASPWTDWTAVGFTGLEIFNFRSALKEHAKNRLELSALLKTPERIPVSPDARAILKWDELLTRGLHVNAYAGSDADMIPGLDLPYGAYFRSLSNHLLSESGLTGELDTDIRTVYDALKTGRSYIAIDGIASTEGFSFSAEGLRSTVYAGESIPIGRSVTLKINLPVPALCRLIHNGQVLRQWDNLRRIPLTVYETGYYRVEAYLPMGGELRGWIFSNPIYVIRGSE